MDRIDTRVFQLERFIDSMSIDFSGLYNKYQGNPPVDELKPLIRRKKAWKNELRQLKIQKKRLQKIKKIIGEED